MLLIPQKIFANGESLHSRNNPALGGVAWGPPLFKGRQIPRRPRAARLRQARALPQVM